ncbi:MAG TPA: hypothetical protein VMS95_04135 [Candidatus Krumholzibacteriaceae bacterium]|jgi:hypothetical protein|nr:hypothetical protein [Candidatus Krumholzibacteriaceae bacterium]
MIVGYSGYLFICNTTAIKDCVKNKTFSCPIDAAKISQKIGIGSVLFLYNPDSQTVVGPFTVATSKMKLEPGAWITDTEHDFPKKFGVEWEEVHEIKNATKEFPFLAEGKSCALTELQTQGLFHVLMSAPLFKP